MYSWKLLVFSLVFSISTLAQQICSQSFLDRKSLAEAQIGRTFDFKDTLSFLREEQRTSSVGKINQFFSQRFKTRIFHNQLALPNKNGQQPVVDPKAKALIVFFHGSGTM